MSYSIKVTSAPANEPLDLDEVKTALKIETSDTSDDDILNLLITKARQEAERITGRALITQTVQFTLDGVPSSPILELPKPPLISVTSVEEIDEDETATTFASSNYRTDKDMTPGRIILKDGKTWPSITIPHRSFRVTYQAGYGAAYTDVPEGLRAAMLRIVMTNYEFREDLVAGAGLGKIPQTAQMMLREYKVWSFSWRQ